MQGDKLERTTRSLSVLGWDEHQPWQHFPTRDGGTFLKNKNKNLKFWNNFNGAIVYKSNIEIALSKHKKTTLTMGCPLLALNKDDHNDGLEKQ